MGEAQRWAMRVKELEVQERDLVDQLEVEPDGDGKLAQTLRMVRRLLEHFRGKLESDTLIVMHVYDYDSGRMIPSETREGTLAILAELGYDDADAVIETYRKSDGSLRVARMPASVWIEGEQQ